MKVFNAALVCVVLLAGTVGAQDRSLPWPGAGGPEGSWTAVGPAPPDFWSVTLDRNIRWRTPLPEGGQSGIAIGGGRVFLTTLRPWEADPENPEARRSRHVLGHCLDEGSGELLWSVEVPGTVDSPNLYAYSDSSTPTPVTDGEHVWFVNASGGMGCFTLAGDLVWMRSWRPWAIDDTFPFNKQFEPILVNGWLLNVEPVGDEAAVVAPGASREHGWNYIHGFDAKMGKLAWVAEDATTTYNTPVLGLTEAGGPALMHGRGGWHGVPETPVGLSMTSLDPASPGKTVWRWIAGTDGNGEALAQPGTLGAPTWQALYVQHWTPRHAVWFQHNPIESHLVFDARNGKLERSQSLVHGVDLRRWNGTEGRYVLHAGVNLRDFADTAPRMNWDAEKDVLFVHPAWHCNLLVHGYHYFLCSTAHGRNARGNATRPERRGKAGPSHSVGRVHLETGKVEYLELPVQVVRREGEPDRLRYGEAQRTTTLNARGLDIAAEDRSRTDGWEIPAFWGSPTAVNDRIYFTTTLGLTYVIDADAETLDERALVALCDLGTPGDTWSMGAVSYGRGRLFHRSLREVICIGE